MEDAVEAEAVAGVEAEEVAEETGILEEIIPEEIIPEEAIPEDAIPEEAPVVEELPVQIEETPEVIAEKEDEIVMGGEDAEEIEVVTDIADKDMAEDHLEMSGEDPIEIRATAEDGAEVVITGYLPEDAEAVIFPVIFTSDELIAYFGEELAASMKNFVAYDISIWSGGAEWQPDESVSVQVIQPAIELAEKETLTAVHFEETETATALTEVAASVTEEGTIEFEAEGFSVYAFFTVDFHNEELDLTFSIEGETSILLSEVFAQLEMDFNAADVTGVVFSDETLVAVEPVLDEPGAIVDWLLTSLAPFDTDETLTMTFADGSVKEMWVSDASSGTIEGEDVNFIIVQKIFRGIEESQIPAGFKVKVSSGSNVYELKKSGGTIEPSVVTDEQTGEIVLTWRIDNAGTGTYSVSEEGTEIENYNLVTTGDIGRNITVAKSEIGIDVPEIETTCSHRYWPISLQGDTNILFAASITGKNGQGTALVSLMPLSAAQKEAVRARLASLDSAVWKTPIHSFVVTAGVEETFQISAGASITYRNITSEHLNEVDCSEKRPGGYAVLNDTSAWQHCAIAQFSISAAAMNPEIQVINTYTPNTIDVTVDKNMTVGSGTFPFEATITYNGAAWLPDLTKHAAEWADFTVADGKITFSLDASSEAPGSIVLPGIPKGASITVRETSHEGYSVSYIVGDNGTLCLGDACNVSNLQADTAITFTNTAGYELPSTGGIGTTIFYIVGSILLVAAVVLLVTRKRMGAEEVEETDK